MLWRLSYTEFNNSSWSIPTSASSPGVCKTAWLPNKSLLPNSHVSTPFGLFEFVRMPFGLRNASQTFQRHIDSIFSDLNFVTAYIDDILIFSIDEDSHKQHLKEVFKRLSNNKLRISVGKCDFFKEIEFLGCTINVPKDLKNATHVWVRLWVLNLLHSTENALRHGSDEWRHNSRFQMCCRFRPNTFTCLLKCRKMSQI